MRFLNINYCCFIFYYYFGISVEAGDIDSTDAAAADAKFEFLLQRVERLETRNAQLETRNDRMERNIEKIQIDFETKEKILTERVSELERQNDLLRKSKIESYYSVSDKNKEVRIGLNEMHEYFNKSKTSKGKTQFIEPEPNTNRGEDNDQHQSELFGQKKHLGSRRRRATRETEVAFFATVTPHDILHLGQNQNIVFDNAVTNIGNAYHATHGIFTAPVDGTYVFCATVDGVHGADDKTHYAHFDINDKNVAKFLTHYGEQSTQMIVLQLLAGDDVSVKNDRPDDRVLGDKYTSFSGFLLYQNFGSSVNILGK